MEERVHTCRGGRGPHKNRAACARRGRACAAYDARVQQVTATHPLRLEICPSSRSGEEWLLLRDFAIGRVQMIHSRRYTCC